MLVGWIPCRLVALRNEPMGRDWRLAAMSALAGRQHEISSERAA